MSMTSFLKVKFNVASCCYGNQLNECWPLLACLYLDALVPECTLRVLISDWLPGEGARKQPARRVSANYGGGEPELLQYVLDLLG